MSKFEIPQDQSEENMKKFFKKQAQKERFERIKENIILAIILISGVFSIILLYILYFVSSR